MTVKISWRLSTASTAMPAQRRLIIACRAWRAQSIRLYDESFFWRHVYKRYRRAYSGGDVDWSCIVCRGRHNFHQLTRASATTTIYLGALGATVFIKNVGRISYSRHRSSPLARKISPSQLERLCFQLFLMYIFDYSICHTEKKSVINYRIGLHNIRTV